MHPLVAGKVTIGTVIRFEEVPLKAPNGDLLASNVRFWVIFSSCSLNLA